MIAQSDWSPFCVQYILVGVSDIDTALALQVCGSRCYITCVCQRDRFYSTYLFMDCLYGVFFFFPCDFPHAEFSTHDALHVAYPGIPQTWR